MIKEISLKNFKCFKEETVFPLSKINLLTGINGRGKSTLLQSLLLMRQTIEHNVNSTQIIFNGSCVRLGAFEDVKNSDVFIGEPISMGYKCRINKRDVAINYFLSKNDDNELIANINRVDIDGTVFLQKGNSNAYTRLEREQNSEYIYMSCLSLINDFSQYDRPANLFAGNSYDETDNAAKFHRIHYIAADRIGPKDYYAKNNLSKFINVGPQGENTAIVLARKQEDIVFDKLYLGENAKTVLQQTEEWLNKIFDGAKIKLESGKDIISLSYNTKLTDKRYKPSNVGFGYSYILPIIVSGLIAKDGEILIVENPEAHLHPKAQSQLTKFLAKVADCGVQVFIESHSEHILNALRVAAATGETGLLHTDMSVLYFQDNEIERFISIPINSDGGIDVWPEGFFDQTDKDFKILFGF